ncbi:hypothetical protein K1719_008932 [Acacia pycnantha]|nr:hypothetical protein K1719_008932 [Acacia pycnantha]
MREEIVSFLDRRVSWHYAGSHPLLIPVIPQSPPPPSSSSSSFLAHSAEVFLYRLRSGALSCMAYTNFLTLLFALVINPTLSSEVNVYSVVSFIPLEWRKKRSVRHVLSQIENCVHYKEEIQM